MPSALRVTLLALALALPALLAAPGAIGAPAAGGIELVGLTLPDRVSLEANVSIAIQLRGEGDGRLLLTAGNRTLLDRDVSVLGDTHIGLAYPAADLGDGTVTATLTTATGTLVLNATTRIVVERVLRSADPAAALATPPVDVPAGIPLLVSTPDRTLTLVEARFTTAREGVTVTLDPQMGGFDTQAIEAGYTVIAAAGVGLGDGAGPIAAGDHAGLTLTFTVPDPEYLQRRVAQGNLLLRVLDASGIRDVPVTEVAWSGSTTLATVTVPRPGQFLLLTDNEAPQVDLTSIDGSIHPHHGKVRIALPVHDAALVRATLAVGGVLVATVDAQDPVLRYTASFAPGVHEGRVEATDAANHTIVHTFTFTVLGDPSVQSDEGDPLELDYGLMGALGVLAVALVAIWVGMRNSG